MNHSYIGTSADGLEKLAVGSNGNFEHIRLDHPTVIGRGKQEIRVQDIDQNISTICADYD